MSEQALRKAIIKLAHEQPETRPYLLPLLKQAGGSQNIRRPLEIELQKEILGRVHNMLARENGNIESAIHRWLVDFRRRHPEVSMGDPKAFANDLVYHAKVDFTQDFLRKVDWLTSQYVR